MMIIILTSPVGRGGELRSSKSQRVFLAKDLCVGLNGIGGPHLSLPAACFY